MIKGFIRLEFRSIKTDKLLRSLSITNLITNYAYQKILNQFPQNVFGTSQVFVSDSQSTPDPLMTTVNYLAVGVAPVTGAEYNYYLDFDPPFIEVQNIINPPASGIRTFWSVGLREKSGNPLRVLAYTKLDIPCDQDSNTYITVFYRWQFEDEVSIVQKAINPRELKKVYIQSISSNTTSLYTIYGLIVPYDLASSDRDRLYDSLGSKNLLTTLTSAPTEQRWDSQAAFNSFFKYKFTKLSGTDKNVLVGRVFGGLLYLYNNNQKTYHAYTKFRNIKEPINAIFCHRGTELVPFFDPAAAGRSSGIISFTGTWTKKAPTFLQILITKAGATGVAEYRFQYKRTLGFLGNSYSRLELPNIWKLPQTLPSIVAAPYTKAHGWQEASNDVLAYSNEQVVFYDTDGASLINIMDGTHTDWDVTTAPSLAVSAIAQCATDGSKIYVACRNTGFWTIDVAANTVTRLLTEPCYGVDVGRNGRVWVVTQGGVRTSLNNYGAALSLNFADLNGNWQRAYYIKCDPSDVLDKCAIAYDKSGTVTICWVQGSNNTCTLGLGSRCTASPATMDVSDTGSFWASFAGSSYGLTFASTGSQNLNTLPSRNSRAKIAFIGANVITNDSLRNSSNVAVVSYTTLSGIASNFVVHLGDGLVMSELWIYHLFSTVADGWTNMGWNGSAWVEGNASSKVTHADAQDILDGLKIQFANGTATAPIFDIGERFNVPICWGLWKTNIVTFSFNAAWYSKDVVFDEPINAPIPNAAPYKIHLTAGDRADFFALETDSLSLVDIAIAGVPPTAKKISPALPASGEIAIDVTNKDLIFNAADAGKLVAGTYAWIKV